MLVEALRASELLADIGLHAEVIDPISLVPLDIETIIESVQRTGRLLVVDNAWTSCGASAEIVARVVEGMGPGKPIPAADGVMRRRPVRPRRRWSGNSILIPQDRADRLRRGAPPNASARLGAGCRSRSPRVSIEISRARHWQACRVSLDESCSTTWPPVPGERKRSKRSSAFSRRTASPSASTQGLRAGLCRLSRLQIRGDGEFQLVGKSDCRGGAVLQERRRPLQLAMR